MSLTLYPLLFNPIFKERIWGGTKLKTDLGKAITSNITGESWELSAVPEDVSTVANGVYNGKPLTALIEEYPEALLGTKVHNQFGIQFPLLFKFLDAKQDLSIQVHPNDALARKRHNSFGKTEMWYIMQADEGAKIIVGFKEDTTPKAYLEHLEQKNLKEILNEVEVKKGDIYFLETGTVHAIGAGIVLAEIQQTSDITYRIYDWDRTDDNGKPRELHVDLALDAMNYTAINCKKEYKTTINQSNPAVHCPYFTTNYLPVKGNVSMLKNGDSFIVYVCTEGSYSVIIANKEYQFTKGDTILIPAELQEYNLEGEAILLEIFIS